jgi:hypothetical protein
MAACGAGDNPLRETALGISTAAAIGRSVQLGLDAVSGAQVAGCVQVTQACSTYPCDGAATLSLGGGCPLPLGGAAAGTVTVMGRFTSSTDATFSATFADVTAGAEAKPIALANVTTVSARRSGNTVEVKYTGSTAAARAGLTAASIGAASSWTIDVDTRGTPDPTDDLFTIDSSSASGSAGLGASAKAATLDRVIVDPSCALNPIAGEGSITEVSGFIPRIDKIAFHAECDGKGLVNGRAWAFDTTP